MYLSFLSKYFVYAFIWGSFISNGDGKVLPSCLHSMKKPKWIFTDFLSDHAILSISTSLILMDLLFLWKALFMMSFSLK